MVDSPLVTPDALAPPAGQPQYSKAFLNSDAFVAYHEGGKTRNDGIGHKAAFGIDQNAHPDIDVLSLTPRQAQAIRYKYWQAINGDRLAEHDPRAAMIAYDTAIASGPGTAVKMLQNHGADAAKMYQARVNYMESLVARDPAKYGPVAASWRRNNDNLGKTLGLIPGAPNMPPLDKLAANGVYTPPGYEPDSAAPGRSIRYGDAQKLAPGGASQLAPQQPAAEQPAPEPEKSTLEKVGDALQSGVGGANKAEGKSEEAPAIPTTKPNIPLPTGPIAPDQRELYAKALDTISKRNAANPPTQSPTPPDQRPPIAKPEGQPAGQPTEKEVETPNDSEA